MKKSHHLCCVLTGWTMKSIVSLTWLCCREEELARLEQYEKDLEEMRERVQKRPLLFERETQVIPPALID